MPLRMPRTLLLAGCCVVLSACAPRLAGDDRPTVERGIEFARAGDTRLALDLYRTEHVADRPLIVWVHGGAWRRGSRQSMPLSDLVRQGYTVASVDYRLSPVAPFPAQVHDIKAAIRFLRARQQELGVDAGNVVIAGSSAGGHLAALVGVTNGHPELEGTVGDCLDQSSDVQAIVDFYGPTNFMTILKQSTPHGLGVRIPALQLLLQGQPEDNPELARLASPVFHVDADDPPLLLIHGDQDPQVPINQSHELQGHYLEQQRPVEFEVVYGGAHGGEQFHDDKRTDVLLNFLKRHF